MATDCITKLRVNIAGADAQTVRKLALYYYDSIMGEGSAPTQCRQQIGLSMAARRHPGKW